MCVRVFCVECVSYLMPLDGGPVMCGLDKGLIVPETHRFALQELARSESNFIGPTEVMKIFTDAPMSQAMEEDRVFITRLVVVELMQEMGERMRFPFISKWGK